MLLNVALEKGHREAYFNSQGRPLTLNHCDSFSAPIVQGSQWEKDAVKQTSVSVFLGVILALGVVAALQPLNAGAISLVVFLCVGATTTIGTLLHRRSKGGPKND